MNGFYDSKKKPFPRHCDGGKVLVLYFLLLSTQKMDFQLISSYSHNNDDTVQHRNNINVNNRNNSCHKSLF